MIVHYTHIMLHSAQGTSSIRFTIAKGNLKNLQR